MQNLAAWALLQFEFLSTERRVDDRDAAFLNRCDQEVLAALALKHGCEHFYESAPADWRLQIEPRPIGRDPHVEIAAKWRIPQMHRGRAGFSLFPSGAGDGIKPTR